MSGRELPTGLAYVRARYGAPAFRGTIVCWEDARGRHWGRITAARGTLRVRPHGAPARRVFLHPRDNLSYWNEEGECVFGTEKGARSCELPTW